VIPADIEECGDILAVVLFGSVARGDADLFSEKDVFVICDDLGNTERFRRLKQRCRECFGEGVSAYKRRDVREMVSAGSLFLWHLKLEGQILLSRKGAF